MTSAHGAIRKLATAELTEAEIAEIRALLRAAFEGGGEGFTDEDWAHATGGAHFLLSDAGLIVAHAAVVERELHAGDLPIRAGYVEAVATRPASQRRGHGSRLMATVHEHIRALYELGALSAASPAFYARLGWEAWEGPTGVRTAAGTMRTSEDDDGIMILTTPTSPPLDQASLLSCPWRPGDVW